MEGGVQGGDRLHTMNIEGEVQGVNFRDKISGTRSIRKTSTLTI